MFAYRKYVNIFIQFIGKGVLVLYNPYKVLGVSSTTKKTDIKAEYRRLSKLYHPDNLVSGNVVKFQEIKKAWEYIDLNHRDTPFLKETRWVHKTLFTISKEVI